MCVRVVSGRTDGDVRHTEAWALEELITPTRLLTSYDGSGIELHAYTVPNQLHVALSTDMLWDHPKVDEEIHEVCRLSRIKVCLFLTFTL